MHIIGLGNDLCNIERIQNSLDRFGQRFINRVFTETEIAKAERRELTRAATYAKRFAAKEACSKALGTCYRSGVFLTDICGLNLLTCQSPLYVTTRAIADSVVHTPTGMSHD